MNYWQVKTQTPVSGSHPDGVVLAAGDHAARRRSQHCDGLLVSALHGARQLAADHILAGVTGRRRHASLPGGTCSGTSTALLQMFRLSSCLDQSSSVVLFFFTRTQQSLSQSDDDACSNTSWDVLYGENVILISAEGISESLYDREHFHIYLNQFYDNPPNT